MLRRRFRFDAAAPMDADMRFFDFAMLIFYALLYVDAAASITLMPWPFRLSCSLLHVVSPFRISFARRFAALRHLAPSSAPFISIARLLYASLDAFQSFHIFSLRAISLRQRFTPLPLRHADCHAFRYAQLHAAAAATLLMLLIFAAATCGAAGRRSASAALMLSFHDAGH